MPLYYPIGNMILYSSKQKEIINTIALGKGEKQIHEQQQSALKKEKKK